MTLSREPWGWEGPQKERAAEAGVHHKIVRDRVQRVGRGALACPACNLPMLLGEAMAVSAPIECPFCGEVRPARQFVRPDVIDTPRNEVHLIARLPA